MQNCNIGFIGAGNMAGAIISALSAGGFSSDLYAYDIDREKTARFKSVKPCSGIAELVSACGCVFFAVKPQNISVVLKETAACDGISNKVFVSIAAGVSISCIADGLGDDKSKIVRLMPNAPMLLGLGATAVCASPFVTPDELTFVKRAVESCGIAEDVDEEYIDAITAVSGSAPAYLFVFARAVCDYAASVGIDRDTALRLFCQTMTGSAAMLLHDGRSAEELIKLVASPGGTTLAALDALEKGKFSETVQDALIACERRAAELGR